MGLAAPVHAQEAGADGDAERRGRQARVVFEDANRFLAAGKLTEALERYQIAYELAPRAKILLNIATLQFELGEKVEAANGFALYLTLDDVEAERVERVEELIARLDEELGRVVLRVKGPAGAIGVDGRVIVEAGGNVETSQPFEHVVRVLPGDHTITVERPGKDPERRQVAIAAGAVQELTFTAPVPPPIDPSTIAALAASGRESLITGFLRLDIDPRNQGVVAAPGATVRIASAWHLSGNGLIGGNNGGVELGARWEPGQSRLRMRLSASLPMFFDDGVRIGGRAAAGAVWGHRFLGFAEVALAYHPSVPEGADSAVLLVAAGAEMGF